MEFKLRPARRGQIYARLLLFAESGHGKTYTALAVAFHLADLYGIPPEAIAILDTEIVESVDRTDEGTGSAEKYWRRPCNCNRCHRQGLVFDGFQTMLMEDGSRGPEEFQRALAVCKQAGIQILVLDGITDEWRSLLQIVDQVNAQTRGKGDGWSTARPLHNAFERAIMEYPGHVIVTCRAKRESRHKKAEEGPADVLPDQDGNVVYRYDVALFLKQGMGYVAKTRDDRLENVSSRHPGADLAEALKRWCDDPRAATASATRIAAVDMQAPDNLPQTAPNTRTDVAQGRVPVNVDPTPNERPDPTSAHSPGGPADPTSVSASGATGPVSAPSSQGTSTPAKTPLIADLEAKCSNLAEIANKLGLDVVAKATMGDKKQRQRSERELTELAARIEAKIAEEEDRREREAASGADDPTAGFDTTNLPF